MHQATDFNTTVLWQQRWRAPHINWTQLAMRAPDRGLASSNKPGKFQLFAWDVRTSELRQLTNRPHGQRSGSITPDGRWIYFLQDEQGNEMGHYVRIPFEGGEVQDITPDLPPYASYGLAFSPLGNQLGLSVVDSEGSHIYTIPIDDNGRLESRQEIYHSQQMAFDPTFSYDGEIVVIASTEPTGKPQYTLLAFALSPREQIGILWDGAGTNMKAVGFSPKPGDLRLLGSTNRSGVERPLIWNPATGNRTDLDLPDLEGDVVPVDWSPDATQVLLCQTSQATQQLLLYGLSSGALTKLAHPAGCFETSKNRGTYFYTQSEIFAGWEDALHPPQLIALDAQTGIIQRKVLVAAETLPGHPLQSIHVPSSAGQMIQGWLGRPDGEGPFPTILYLHGGPEFVVMNWFDPESQAWIDHGFAFLTINYRGSTTFGRDFQEKIWGDLGHWEVEDMVAAHDWLVKNRVARADQIFLSGWSYGGYLTLLGLGKRPELWAGGMAGAAIADWRLNFEDQAATLRGYTVLALGGTPAEKPEQYIASSPLTYATDVKAPILIIQGRSDTRTPPRQVEVYETKLRELDKSIKVHWYNTGHVGGDSELGIQHRELMLRFACGIVGKEMFL